MGRLNSQQRKIVVISIAIFVLIGLFPPWVYTFKHKDTYSAKSAGYAFIAVAPPPEQDTLAHGVKIDLSRLLIQWVLLVGVSGGVLLLAPRKEGEDG